MTAVLGDLASELAALATRIRAGEAVAETELVTRYQRAARAIARRHCRPHEAQVDDIVQDVLTDLLHRLRRGLIADAKALPQYLQLSIRNACTAHYRRQSRMQSSGAEDDVQAVVCDPSDFSVRQERARLLRVLVAELPIARDRELLRRFYLWEQSREEVCGALAISDEHFHRVVHRARQRLREAMTRTGFCEL